MIATQNNNPLTSVRRALLNSGVTHVKLNSILTQLNPYLAELNAMAEFDLGFARYINPDDVEFYFSFYKPLINLSEFDKKQNDVKKALQTILPEKTFDVNEELVEGFLMQLKNGINVYLYPSSKKGITMTFDQYKQFMKQFLIT